MTALVVVLNAVLGAVYVSYGVLTILELRRGWTANGPSLFGLAWIAMAFTCGPHHLDHAVHAAVDGAAGASSDVLAVVLGLTPGVTWFLLRVEAHLGGPGDRTIAGTPSWLRAVVVLTVAGSVVLAGVLVADLVRGDAALSPRATPNLLLVGLYMAIGFYLARTQLANRPVLEGWSASGLSLTAVFPTCAAMHAAFATQVLVGGYHADAHILVVDWLSVPASIFFLYVIRSLLVGRGRDWNQATTGVLAQAAV